MRILHTSDWHLGKRLFKLDRAHEHELFLGWLIQTIKTENIDVLLIAGDIFDTPTPPHQSLETFYNFLHRISLETCAETLIIAGNHDSGLLLEAPSKLLKLHRVKVWGKLSPDPRDHWHRIGDVEFCCVPFFRSYELMRDVRAGTEEVDPLGLLNKYLRKEKTHPQILMFHHLAGMYEASGSEQVISLSGVDSIPTETFDCFDYVALGHIHKPQKIGAKVYYSGSPIPLRFSETLRKSVVLVEEQEGTLSTRHLTVPVFRDLFIVKTNENTYKKDLEALERTAELSPMVEVQMELSSPKVGLIDEIKEILSKKDMELLSYLPLYERSIVKEKSSEKLFKLSPLELFEEFYKTKYPEEKEIPSDLKEDFKNLLLKVQDAPHST